MRTIRLGAVLALSACAGSRSQPGPETVGGSAAGSQLVQCAQGQMEGRGYSVSPDDVGRDRVRGEKTLPPDRGYESSVGVVTAWVRYGRDGRPGLKVRAQRFGRSAASVEPRGVPGRQGPAPFPVPGNTTIVSGSGGGRRIPLGEVAADAAGVEAGCRS